MYDSAIETQEFPVPATELATPLTVTVTRADEAVVVSLGGAAEVATSDDLACQVEGAAASHPRVLILELSRLQFLNSLTLRTFIELHRTVARAGGQVRIAGPTPYVAGVLTQTAIDRLMPVYPTLEKALAAPLPPRLH
jgi:anti-sigma B factor antagonist